MPRLVVSLALAAFLVPLPTAAQPAPGDLIINEVMYAPSPSANEFVELYNRSTSPVALDDLAFADANQDFVPLTTVDTSLSPGAYVVLVRSPEDFEAAFPNVDYLAPDGWSAYNNGGDTVFLRHSPSGTVLDSVPYDPSWGGDDGHSLERLDPAGPSDVVTNFGTSEADVGATPGAQNSIYNPDETPPVLDSVTPVHSGDTLTVAFSEPLDHASVTAEAFRFEDAGRPSVASATIHPSAANKVQCVLASSLTTGDYTLVVEGVADRRGNVLSEDRAAFSYFVPERPVPRDVVVTEIMYAPPSASTEFVELYNRSDKTIDLGTLRIADEDRDFTSFAPPLTPLVPDERVVLVRDPSAFNTAFPEVAHRTPDSWNALNNGGDTVILRHAPSATDLDTVPYEPSWGGSNGRSLERIDPRGPSTHPSNFASSTAPAGATPGARNSRYAPDRAPPTVTFAEQTDSMAAAVIFGEPVQSETVTPDAFQFSEATVTRASLRADSVAKLTLSEAPTATTISVSGVRDLVGNRLEEATHPFAQRPTPGALVVNEILFDPRADDFDDRPNQVEYIELYSLADHPVTLNGLLLTDRPTETGTADTIHAGQRRVLSPGTFAVVAAAPSGATMPQQSQLATAFPEAPLSSDAVAFLPVDANQLGLRNDGDLIRVHRRDRALVTEVDYSPDWHTSGLADTKGTALERISPTGGADAPDNWTSSTRSSGGTPGAANAASLAPPDDAPDAPGLRIQPDPFSISRDGATRIHFTLSEPSSLVRVRIYDARGRKVRSLEKARLAGRSGELVWNGRDDAGNRVRIGPYVIFFEAVRAEGGTVTHLKQTVVVARPLN